MDLNKLKEHVDARFDKLEDSIRTYAEDRAGDRKDIDHLQGFAKLAITIFMACAGFFAVAYFNK